MLKSMFYGMILWSVGVDDRLAASSCVRVTVDVGVIQGNMKSGDLGDNSQR